MNKSFRLSSAVLKQSLHWVVACILILSVDGLQAQKTFSNPILPSGADPYSTYHQGFYYYVNATGTGLVLRKTKNLSDLASAEKMTIWEAPQGTLYAQNVWAPEIHFIQGSWYVYFAADDGTNDNHRMYAISNISADPFTETWQFEGKIATPADRWAIDGNVFNYKDQLYMIWSGWEGNKNGRQDLYIAKMKNPISIQGERVKISSPTLDWERHWQGGPEVYVNEGP